MANKFGKFLLFTAAVGTATATAYYFLHKNNTKQTTSEDDSDYDDFNDDLDDENNDTERNYVPLTRDNTASIPEEATKTVESIENDSPLEPIVEKIEEFFDEDDHSINEE